MLTRIVSYRLRSKSRGRANVTMFFLLLGMALVSLLVIRAVVQLRQRTAPFTVAEHQWLIAIADHLATSDLVVNGALESLSHYIGRFPPATPVNLDPRISALRVWLERGGVLALRAPPRFRYLGQEYSSAMDEIAFFFNNTPPAATRGDVSAMAESIRHMGRGGKCFKDVRAQVLSLLASSTTHP